MTSPEATEPDADPRSVARSICLKLLTGQPRTRAELATALRKRNVPDDAAAEVLDRFTDVGLIDDAAFAASWVQSRHNGRGLGRRALSSELRRKGVDPDIVDSAVDVVSRDDEVEAAQRLVTRKLATMSRLDSAAKVRRLTGMLVRKGYDSGVALRVVREAMADDAAADDLIELD